MKQDLRVIRTKSALKESLLTLLKENTFEKITVSELCDTARINRVTFYSHYHDKYELFLDYVSDISDRISRNAMQGLKSGTRQEQIIEFCLNSFNCALDEMLRYRDVVVTFGHQENSLLVYMLQKSMIQDLKKLLEEVCADRATKFPLQHISAFIVGGMTQLLYDCFESRREESIEEFRKYGMRLIDNLLRNDFLFY